MARVFLSERDLDWIERDRYTRVIPPNSFTIAYDGPLSPENFPNPELTTSTDEENRESPRNPLYWKWYEPSWEENDSPHWILSSEGEDAFLEFYLSMYAPGYWSVVEAKGYVYVFKNEEELISWLEKNPVNSFVIKNPEGKVYTFRVKVTLETWRD